LVQIKILGLTLFSKHGVNLDVVMCWVSNPACRWCVYGVVYWLCYSAM